MKNIGFMALPTSWNIAPDAREQGVRADQFRGLFGEVRHLQAVLVGARGIAQKELQQGQIGARDFDQLQGGRQPKACARKYCKNNAMLEEASPLKTAAPASSASPTPSVGVNGSRNATSIAMPAHCDRHARAEERPHAPRRAQHQHAGQR